MQPALDEYDHVIIFFSGGKDSIACHLHALEAGVDPNKIELWHHNVDGDHGAHSYFDWKITRSYCMHYSYAFNVPLFFSWREGGLNREMHRQDQTTAGVVFEYPVPSRRGRRAHSQTYLPPSNRAQKNTRMKFPQVTANLSQRWCSASAKIDVSSRAINNQERFKGKKTLVISGERAEESSARAKYKTFEPHRCNTKSRHVDAWRPVHGWSEQEVWDIMKRHKVRAHPAYELGFGRVSCMNCIFSSPDQIASVRALDPDRFDWVVAKEKEFGLTIHRTRSWEEQLKRGKPYQAIADNPDIVAVNQSGFYSLNIITDDWKLPAGAFGESTGPT